jgi:hypothetical protein
VNIGVLPLAGEDKSPRLFEASRFTQAFAQVSPSSRWIVYGSIESGRYEIYAQSFPTPGGGKWQISRDGAHLSRWRRDGRELVFYAADSKLVAVQTNDGSVLDVGAATPLFEGRLLNGPTVSTGFRQQFDLAPDGRRLLLNLPVEQAAPPSIVVVLNALAGLKR